MLCLLHQQVADHVFITLACSVHAIRTGRHQATRERARHGVEGEQATADRAMPLSHLLDPPKANGAFWEAPSLGAAALEADAVNNQPRSFRVTAASPGTAGAGSPARPHRHSAAMHIAAQGAAERAGQKTAAIQQPAALPRTAVLVGRTAVQSTPTSAVERPIHSPLGPPVTGKQLPLPSLFALMPGREG